MVSANSSELDRDFVSAFPGLKIKYVTLNDHIILPIGQTRSPTSGFANTVEYSVIEIDSSKTQITIEKKSASEAPYIYNSTMEKFGIDILIIPDWEYWKFNISQTLDKMKDNPSYTSLKTTTIEENNIYGYRVEIETFNTEFEGSKTEITEYSYEKSRGALNYRRIYTEQEFNDGNREIVESIIKLEENHDDYKSNDVDRSYIYILVSIFAIATVGRLVYIKIKK